MRRLLVGFICFFTVPLHAAQRDNLSVWFVDSLVKVFPEGTVKVNAHPTDTPSDEVVRSAVGPYPDPLFPLEKEIALEASRTEALWISVFAPKATRAGTYRGMVEIDA